ncbi:MAG: non-canonical purine NTP pyrophosphatase [Pirellulaceae bacterium]|nr:MAG: non-canonical purine NTP pyrophosphatase [Pirellulaceae bacterium]
MNTSQQVTPTPLPSSERMPQQLVLGTHNRKKRYEMELLLQPLGITLRSLDDFESPLHVEEPGDSFLENATLKAVEQAQHLGQWVIGEDSGLCVPYLGGRPGVHSARYSGPNATDEQNNAKLLTELGTAAGQQRRAYYVSTLVLASPSGQVHAVAEGKCWGTILSEPRGSFGFGYDPLFEISEYHRTFAELGDAVKSVLSHRARAMERFRQALSALNVSS